MLLWYSQKPFSLVTTLARAVYCLLRPSFRSTANFSWTDLMLILGFRLSPFSNFCSLISFPVPSCLNYCVCNSLHSKSNRPNESFFQDEVFIARLSTIITSCEQDDFLKVFSLTVGGFATMIQCQRHFHSSSTVLWTGMSYPLRSYY